MCLKIEYFRTVRDNIVNMKVVMAMSISLNGLVARENGEEDWLPYEGWDELLVVEVKNFNNIVMGRETYELVTTLYPDYNFDSVTAAKKVIVTRNRNYTVPGEEYEIVHSPEEALSLLEMAGMDRVLLLGGGKLNTEFLMRRLVDEIWLTINPFILGQGRPFISPDNFENELQLQSCEQITKDRLLVKYSVSRQ